MKSTDDSALVQAVCQDCEPCGQGSREGGDDQRFSECAELSALLLTQWGITLWRLKVKGKQIKLKMEASRPVDERALRGWLAEQLGADREISIQFCAMSTCCGRGCKGCFIGNPASG